ncbi:hypothetical protein [Bremerella cremea]|uniref:hypothetical protein n=1 Tax=Bremerella cremea TaxID=1031537 RepID=UPI0031F151E8
MSVVDHKLSWNGATGSWESSGKRTYAAIYLVRTDDPLDNIVTVNNYIVSNILALGSVYAYGNDIDYEAFAQQIAPQRIAGSSRRWLVTISYETMDDENEENKAGKDEDGNASTNPLEWRDVPSVSRRAVTEPVRRAKFLQDVRFIKEGSYGVPMNQAGQIFDPPLEHEVWHEILRIEHYDDYFPNDSEDWVGTVNSSTVQVNYPYAKFIRTWTKYKEKLLAWDGVWQRVNNVDCWRWTLEFENNRRGWQISVPNIGTYARATVDPLGDYTDFDENGEPYDATANPAPETGMRQLRDATGAPLTDPIPLDSNGRPKPPGDDVDFLEFLVDDEKDFNVLRSTYKLFGKEP